MRDTVLLHSTCPSVLVPSVTLAEVTSLLKHSGTTTSSVIRRIMYSLIDTENWSKKGMNFKTLTKEFANQFAACVGKY